MSERLWGNTPPLIHFRTRALPSRDMKVTTDVLLLSRLKTKSSTHVHIVAAIYSQDKFTFHIALYFLIKYMYTDMRRLTTGISSENAALGDFVVVRAS